MWDNPTQLLGRRLYIASRRPTAIVDGDHDEAIKREHTEYPRTRNSRRQI